MLLKKFLKNSPQPPSLWAEPAEKIMILKTSKHLGSYNILNNEPNKTIFF